MPRYRKPPLTLADLEHDGPPVRLRDLVAITGLTPVTVRSDIHRGNLTASKRQHGETCVYLVQRVDALRWLAKMGWSVPRSALG